MFPLAPCLVSFPCFSTAPSRFLSTFQGNHPFFRALSRVWGWFGPKISRTVKILRCFAGIPEKSREPGIPGKYPVNLPVSSILPQILPQTTARPALRLRETRELPEWSTKHPLVSLEFSGNAKCWGPSSFPLGCRKLSYRPMRALRGEGVQGEGVRGARSQGRRGPS